ncbi:MAG: energy-coupling factor transporter transmembrane protein EcfT [Clostridia bacterium]|nr:energy-coupling factor transporter transmembrane protein EcfT [Clostridia bacterium]
MFLFILLFITFSLFIFITNNIYVLVGFTISNILLHFIFKISPKKALKNLFKIFFLIIIIFLFNLIFDNLINSLIVSYKVLIVANGAFIFSKVITPTRLANGFKQLFLPLKLFKVDTNNLALMLTISLNFIPIISYDITTLKQTLKARNVKLNLKTLFTQSHLLFVMFFANLFKRVDDLELVIRARGCC